MGKRWLGRNQTSVLAIGSLFDAPAVAGGGGGGGGGGAMERVVLPRKCEPGRNTLLRNL